MTTLPATFGGPTFTTRPHPHAVDVEVGHVWRTVGVWNETAPLLEAALVWPPDSLASISHPDEALMLRVPDLGVMRRQMDVLANTFTQLGVHVHLFQAPEAPPNTVFLRDLVFTTPEGCALGRPASPVRAAEPRRIAAALAQLGVPLLGLPRGDAFFEGADALWLDARTLLVGQGVRTTPAALPFLQGVVGPDVTLVPVPLPRGTQHLLGVVVLLDQDLAMVDAARAPASLVQFLSDSGWTTLPLPPSDELRDKRGMNAVVVAPRVAVVPAGCPEIRHTLEKHGVTAVPVDVSGFIDAGGAMGCMTAPLLRRAPQA